MSDFRDGRARGIPRLIQKWKLLLCSKVAAQNSGIAVSTMAFLSLSTRTIYFFMILVAICLAIRICL